MAITTHKTFQLDLTPGGPAPVIHASQGDIGRDFTVEIYNDGYNLPTAVDVVIRGKKPDKTVFEYVVTFDDDTTEVSFSTTEQMTIIPGPVECELVFSYEGDVIASANFVLMVENSPYDPNALSESEITSLNDLIEETVGGDIENAVDIWLHEHPEYITTVQDGAVTTAKLADEAVTSAKVDTDFLETILNAYVTPEQFGAVGDGTTDDTAAIQAAINSGKMVLGSRTTYKTTSALVFNQFNSNKFDFSASTISCTGTEYAVEITNSSNSDFYIKKIVSTTSNGVKLESLQASTYCEYLNLYINEINIRNTAKECITAHAVGDGWVNEVNVWNTRLYCSGGGIHFIDGTTGYSYGIDNWKFYNIGCEGFKPSDEHLKYGYYFENVGTAITSNILIVGGRYGESFDKYIKSSGAVYYVTIFSPYRVRADLWEISEESSSWIMIDGQESKRLFRGQWINTIDYGLVGTQVPADTDINTLPCGRYNTRDNNRVATLTNVPTGAGYGNITVEMLSSTGDITHKWAVIRQTYADYNNRTWTRVLTTNGATPPVITAGAWKEL